jgi:tryptophanyl-tRNA synthetase
MRPTGPLHLGHYVGALENWLELQHEYDCYFLIADYQALGDHIDDIERIRRSVIDVAVDWLSVGLDPEQSPFVVQGYVPEHAELTMYFSMLTPKSWIDRNPTHKAEMQQIEESNETITMGFFNYPLSQVADILLPKANLVPVGEDQLPHIELTREVARRFNRLYGREVFPEPAAKVGRVPRLLGLDGQAKMSKSLDNAIYLSDDAKTVQKKVRRMVTDITGTHPRLKATDPGVVEYNPVFLYHDVFNPDTEEVADLRERYEQGTVSDGEVKDKLVAALNAFLDPIRERRARILDRPGYAAEVLEDGSRREREVAKETIAEVREAMRLVYT